MLVMVWKVTMMWVWVWISLWHTDVVVVYSLVKSLLQQVGLLSEDSAGAGASLLNEVRDGEAEVDGVPDEEGGGDANDHLTRHPEAVGPDHLETNIWIIDQSGYSIEAIDQSERSFELIGQ